MLSMLLPNYVKYLAIAAAAGCIWLLGDLHGTVKAGQIHNDYVMAQAAKTVAIGARQTKVVVQIETVYRDRIQKIYTQGEKIETVVHDLVVPDDDARFRVNAGFVRVLAAGWAGDAPRPATDTDRDPSPIPISSIASSEVGNATSCLAWRSQALGWREFYAGQQEAVNGVTPAWYKDFQSASAKDQALPPAPMAPLTGEAK